MPVSGLGLAAVGFGGVFLWAGIKGYSVPQAFQSILQGKNPITSATVTNSITTSSTPSSGGVGSASGSSIVADAMKYRGAGYVWGGAPAKGIGNWDCSSFCNWVIGHDLGLAIPTYAAGTYDGSSHGPPTGLWLLWGGCTTIGHDPALAQPGDLCVWQTHMGIAIGNGQMISAQDPALGTNVSNIFLAGELLYVRRLN